MFKKNLLLAIGLLLLIQLTACLAKPTSSESEEDNTIPHGTSTTTPSLGESDVPNGRKRLEAIISKNFETFLKYCLERTNKIAQDVLEDPSMNSIASQAMEEEKNLLRKYVKDSKEALLAALPADKNDQHNRIFFAIFVLENFNSFNSRRVLKTEYLTSEQQVSWNAFKKHGVYEYNKEMEKRATDFAKQIVDDFDEYMKALSTVEKEKEKEIVEVYNSYKKTEIGLDKVEFGQKLFGALFKYDSKA